MNSHRRLWVWQVAGDLVVATYALTKALPDSERYILVPQLKRAAWSVQNNIAEGNARLGKAERRHFFDMSLSSLGEVDSMAQTLPRVHRVGSEHLDSIESCRRQITSGLFAMIRRGRS
jgi:four helix bundle protein